MAHKVKRPLPPVRWSNYRLVYFMEKSAEQVKAKLLDYGIRCKVKPCSRTIVEEPYVEHTWAVLIDDGNEQERGYIKRVVMTIEHGGIICDRIRT
jgi:hypothetical protein